MPVTTFIARYKTENWTSKTPGEPVRAVNSSEVTWRSVQNGLNHVPQGHSYRNYKLNVFRLRHPTRCNSQYATYPSTSTANRNLKTARN